MRGLTLDAGALIALERGDRDVQLLLDECRKATRPTTIPATVIAQVMRDPRRQVGLVRLLRHPLTEIDDLDRRAAAAVGQLLGATSTSDLTDAHVALVATKRDHIIVTSDQADLTLLAPGQPIVAV